MLIPNGAKLVMIGDSITDFERARPVGEGREPAIGRSYVQLVDSLLKITYPESRIRIVNMGISGNNVRDLKARWDTDVLDLKPDWVSILIGANDVWRQFDTPLMVENHVPIEEYESTLGELVTISRNKGIKPVLMSPFYMERNSGDAMREMILQYGAAVKRVAVKHGCAFVDLQKAYEDYLAFYPSQSLNWDRVHPDPVGHMIIARAFLNGIEYDWGRNQG